MDIFHIYSYKIHRFETKNYLVPGINVLTKFGNLSLDLFDTFGINFLACLFELSLLSQTQFAFVLQCTVPRIRYFLLIDVGIR